MNIYKIKKTAQERQDEIFRRMSADRKVELGSQLWRLGKDLANKKLNFKKKYENTKNS